MTAVGRFFYENLTLNSAGTFFTDHKSRGGHRAEVTVIRGSTVLQLLTVILGVGGYNWSFETSSGRGGGFGTSSSLCNNEIFGTVYPLLSRVSGDFTVKFGETRGEVSFGESKIFSLHGGKSVLILTMIGLVFDSVRETSGKSNDGVWSVLQFTAVD